MLLVLTLNDFLSTSYTPAYQWLCSYLGVDKIDHVSVQDSKLCITFYNDDGTSTYHYLTDSDIYDALLVTRGKALTLQLVWFLLRHLDIYNDMDTLVHDYAGKCGITVERVPFLCAGSTLMLACSDVKVVKTKNSGLFRLTGGRDKPCTLQMSLKDPTLQNLLFSRLRRTV